MKKVSFTNIKSTRRLLPIGLAMLAVTAVALSQLHNDNFKAAVTKTTSHESRQTSESVVPMATPVITVNGTQIPTDKNGSRDVNIPSGTAHVEVSNGNTRVITSENVKNGDTSNSSSSNVNMNISSQTLGGTNTGSSQTYGYSNSSGGYTSSFSHTSVDSYGTGDVNISR